MVSYFGRAHVSTTDPEAVGECDRCRFWYNRSQLGPQYQWAGAGLIDTGLIVCRGSGTRRCMDVPFEQYRVLILPGDPIPVRNARPSPDTTPPGTNPQQPLGYTVNQTLPLPTDPYNQGFTPFALGGVPPSAAPWEGVAGTPQSGGFPPGYPTTKAATLAAIAAVSAIPVPAGVVDRSITIAAASVTQSLMAANAARAWLLIYSPDGSMSGFSEGSAILGSTTTLMLGPGMAWFWATAQGLGTVYQGALTAVGLRVGMPVWAWEG